MHSKFLTWAQGLYVAGLVLGLIVIIPSAWFPIQLGKVALVAVCMFVAAVLFALGGGGRILLRERGALPLLLVGLIPLTYLLSYYYSIDRTVGLSGFAIEADTVLFVALGYGIFVLGFGLFRSVWSGRILLFGALGAGILAGVFQFISILFGTSILPAIFSDRSVNLIGKWNDLGLLVGLVVVYALFSLEQAELSLRRRVLAIVVALASLLLLAIIYFPLVWALLLCFCLVLALWSFANKRGEAKGIALVPWVPLVGALLCGGLLLWGSVVNSNLTTKYFPVSSLEVRPSLTSTLGVIKASHGASFGRFLVGTGPQTFGEQWLLYKPTSVNQSPFWNLDFAVGFSAIATALGTVGLLGTLAWLLPMALVLLAIIAVVRSGAYATRERYFILALGVGALYLWCGILFYVPSESLILLAFALTAAVLGLSRRQSGDEIPAARHYGAIVLATALVVLLGWSAYGASRRYIAESYINQGLLALQQNDFDSALSLAARAQKVERTGDDLRLAVDAGFAKLQQIAQSAQNPTQKQISDFTAVTSTTIAQGQQAIAHNSKDYRPYLSLGRVYDLLAAVGVRGAYENAAATYGSAAKYDPTNPQIPLLLARLEAGRGNLTGVQTYLSQSLTLKPDYTDAILFVVQLDVAQKDIPSAIIAAQAAVRSAPGIPSIWFELGLLYYSANDTADAVPVLEQAVKIEPDYANAKYFLGLSYAAQGRPQDAIAQFSDLAVSNPDNQEVKLILSNLQAGKKPFDGAQPPVTSTPQNRAQAPISQ